MTILFYDACPGFSDGSVIFLKGVIISLSETGILLVLAAASDVRERKIPNVLVLLGLSIGLMYRIQAVGLSGLLLFGSDICLPVILLYIVYLLHGIGAGDIKLFSMIFGLLGKSAGFYIFAAAFIGAAVVAVLRILTALAVSGRAAVMGEDGILCERMPLAPFILAGYVVWASGLINGV